MKTERRVRYFDPLKKEHIFLIRKWRNEQINVLRQRARIGYKQQIVWFNSLKRDKTQRLFGIFEKINAKKVFIGYCGLTHIDYPNRRAEISFLVDANRKEGGPLYEIDMLNALSFLAGYAFLKLKLERVFTETYKFRKKHTKILERFGFRKEGILRSQIFIKEKPCDSLIHSLLRREYKKKMFWR